MAVIKIKGSVVMKRKNKKNQVNDEAATIESTSISPGFGLGGMTLDGRTGRKKGVLKKFLVVPAVICVLGIIGYLAGVVYYKSHFFKGTNVYGTDVSQMEVEDFEKGLEDYSLKIIQKDTDGGIFEEELSSDALGVTVSSTDELVKIIGEQNEWMWPVQHSAVYAGRPTFIGCDTDKIREAVKSLTNMQKENTVKSQNAYISDYKNGEGYKIIDEVIGNRLDGDAVLQAVESAVKGLKTEIDCEELGLYKKPAVTSDDKKLNKVLDKLNKYTSTNIKYEFGDNTEVLDGDTINKWLSVKKGKVKIDEDEVSEFVASIRKKYDTIFRSRKFKTSYGQTITITGGTMAGGQTHHRR